MFTTPTDSGTNLYIVLVAASGMGKEAMHDGLAKLIRSFPSKYQTFANFNDAASSPALIKALARQRSFTHVRGEFGHELKRFADTSRDPLMQQKRRTLTDLYSKSGPNSVAGGIMYSDGEKNVESIAGAAYSLIGETTPETFFDALTQDMMADGFMSRFLVVDYIGPRPEPNAHRDQALSAELQQRLQHLLEVSLESLSVNRHYRVRYGSDAQSLLQQFDERATAGLDAAAQESVRQLWTRAHLKVLRIASLLAVADQHWDPVITTPHATWAIDFVSRNVDLFLARIKGGDVGIDDHTRETKIKAILKRYFEQPAKDPILEEMRRQGVVPSRYIHQRVSQLAAFKQHRLGATIAYKNTMDSLVDSGYLRHLKPDVIEKLYGAKSGKFFGIADFLDDEVAE